MSITLNLMQAGKVKKSFTSTSAKHAEEVAFATAALRNGPASTRSTTTATTCSRVIPRTRRAARSRSS